MVRLEGKIALITGATGGIGQAAARLFADEGARVVLIDLDEAALQAAVRTIGEERASYAVADVTQPETGPGLRQRGDRPLGAGSIYSWPTPESKVPYLPYRTTPLTSFDRVMAVKRARSMAGAQVCDPGNECTGRRQHRDYVFCCRNPGDGGYVGICHQQTCGPSA